MCKIHVNAGQLRNLLMNTYCSLVNNDSLIFIVQSARKSTEAKASKMKSSTASVRGETKDNKEYPMGPGRR